jgi:ClpX C4-type zinc finger protein
MEAIRPAAGSRQKVRCSFCGLGPGQDRRFVSGPNVCICDDCIRRAHSLLELPGHDDRQLSVGFDDPPS